MNSLPIVEVENVSYAYASASRGGAPLAALKDVSFQVQKGEIFGLLGPNGGGKTTLFKILSTLLTPHSGNVRIAGMDVRSHPHGIRHHLGVAFQFPSLDKKLTAAENLRHHGHLYGLKGRVLEERITRMLGRFNLLERAHDLVENLSGGLARRVELAKTLLHAPEVLLLDEPSTGLDPGARRDLWQQLKLLCSEGEVTVLLTTHLMEEAAACDRLALLHRGQIVALGSPEQMTSEIGGDVVTVHSDDPQELRDEIQEHFQCRVTVLDGILRIEREHGHLFIPQLVEAFPGRIRGISLGKPTLEDVFIHRTGHRLEDN